MQFVDSIKRTSGSPSSFIIDLKRSNITKIMPISLAISNNSNTVPAAYRQMLLTFLEPNLVETTELVQIAAGTYTPQELVIAIQAEMPPNMTITYDSSTDKFTIQNTAGRDFKIPKIQDGNLLPYILGYTDPLQSNFALEHISYSNFNPSVYDKVFLKVNGVIQAIFDLSSIELRKSAVIRFPLVPIATNKAYFSTLAVDIVDIFDKPIDNGNSECVVQLQLI